MTDNKIISPTHTKGISVVQETEVYLTNEPQNVDWKGYGLRLVIPPNSLPKDTESCTINIKTSFSGHYQFPDNTELVSPVFWLQSTPSCKFKNPVTLEIEHCAPLDNSFRLFMATTLHTDPSNLPFIFKSMPGSTFNVNSSYGVSTLEEFNGDGVAAIQERSGERRYWSGVFYMGLPENRAVHFAITWEDDAHITVSSQ